MWQLKISIIPIVVGALGLVKKVTPKHLRLQKFKGLQGFLVNKT